MPRELIGVNFAASAKRHRRVFSPEGWVGDTRPAPAKSSLHGQVVVVTAQRNARTPDSAQALVAARTQSPAHSPSWGENLLASASLQMSENPVTSAKPFLRREPRTWREPIRAREPSIQRKPLIRRELHIERKPSETREPKHQRKSSITRELPSVRVDLQVKVRQDRSVSVP